MTACREFRASTIDEIEPLVALCQAGKLFDVQKWIAEGKPIGLPRNAGTRGTHRNPLRVAIDKGFHSLIQILAEAGAPLQDGSYHALDHAVRLRRADIVTILFKHGARVADVSMITAVDHWDRAIIDLLIDSGADLEAEHPVAWALIYKIRPALGLVKRFGDVHPHVMRQAEVALRHHAYEGNVKWVSLLLWAGADPLARGPERFEYIDEDGFDEEFESALELAVQAGKVDVLHIKGMARLLGSSIPGTERLIEKACHSSDDAALRLLLERGFRLEPLPDHGTATINLLLETMCWEIPDHVTWQWGERSPKNIDSYRAKDCMEKIRLLLAHGGRWLPADKREIRAARRCLLKMAPAYTVKFIQMLKTHNASQRADVVELYRTSTIRKLLAADHGRVSKFIETLPEAID